MTSIQKFTPSSLSELLIYCIGLVIPDPFSFHNVLVLYIFGRHRILAHLTWRLYFRSNISHCVTYVNLFGNSILLIFLLDLSMVFMTTCMSLWFRRSVIRWSYDRVIICHQTVIYTKCKWAAPYILCFKLIFWTYFCIYLRGDSASALS